MKNLWSTIFAVLLATPAYSQDEVETGTFLCISEMATGFAVVNGEWNQQKFKTGKKYIVRPLREGDWGWGFKANSPTVKYGVFGFDNKEYPHAISETGFSYFSSDIFVSTDSLGASGFLFDSFNLNKATFRYTATYLLGWNSQDPDAEQEGGDTPMIEIGSCTRL